MIFKNVFTQGVKYTVKYTVFIKQVLNVNAT